MPGENLGFLAAIGQFVVDIAWYIFVGFLVLLGATGKRYLNKIENAITREEMLRHLKTMREEVAMSQKTMQAEQDYIKSRVDDIYNIMLADATPHRRVGETHERDGREQD